MSSWILGWTRGRRGSAELQEGGLFIEKKPVEQTTRKIYDGMSNSFSCLDVPTGAERQALDLVALSLVKGLGNDGIAALLAELRRRGENVHQVFELSAAELRERFRLRTDAAAAISRQADHLRQQAIPILEKANALGVVLLAPNDPRYPAHIESFYLGRPPLLYAHGNLDLLATPCIAILNSAKPAPQALEHTLALSRRLAEAGRTLVTSPEGAAYNIVGLAAKQAGGTAIIVLHKSLLAFLEADADREPLPLARRLNGRLDRRRTLLVSPFRLDGRWQKGNGPRRDVLLAALAHTLIAVGPRAGGKIDGLCRQAVAQHRTVFVCQRAADGQTRGSAEPGLVAHGALPVVGDAGGTNVDLILRDQPADFFTEVAGDLERRRGLGQFFTPRAVASFMWDMVDILRGHKLSSAARIIDPACGEGVFLQAALERGCRAEQLFGVDIDDSLIPSWQTDTGLQGAHVFRANGLLDNPSIGLEPATFDLVIGNPPFSGKGLRDLLRLLENRANKEDGHADLNGDSGAKSGVKVAPTTLRRHERAVLDYTARQLSRYACWRFRDEDEDEADDNGDSPAAQPAPDRLFADFDPAAGRHLQASDYDRMARLMSDWPDDKLLDLGSPEMRLTIRRLASTAIEVFFTERFVRLAKPGGMIAVIVPESILASDQLTGLRKWFLEETCLLAVVSLPHKVFTGVGANAKTGIIFARRLTNAERQARDKLDGRAMVCRILPELANTQVLMISPDMQSPQWQGCEDYLLGILAKSKEVIGHVVREEGAS